MTHYQVLGVPEDASDEALWLAWQRGRAVLRHGGWPAWRARLLGRGETPLQAAYQTLRDAQRRAAYDRDLAQRRDFIVLVPPYH